MNNNYLDSLSPPSEDNPVPSKRQKMDIIDLSKLQPSNIEPVSEEEWTGLTRELITLRRSLLQTEVTAAHFREITIQIEEVIREEERNLEIYLGMNRETTKQLAVSAGTKMWSALEVREAEATAEVEISQIKIRMKEKFTNLLTKNYTTNSSSRRDTPTLPMTQNNELVSSSILSSKVGYADELEGELQSEEYIIQTLREAEDDLDFKEQTVFIRESNDYPSRGSGTWSAGVTNERPLPPLVPMIPIQENQRANGEEAVSLYPTHDESPPAKAQDLFLPCRVERRLERTVQDLRISVGSYNILVSDAHYFEIDWKSHYTQRTNREFVCNECMATRVRKIRIEDHIWRQHYGGSFTCPLCPGQNSRGTRDGMRQHMRTVHGNGATPQR